MLLSRRWRIMIIPPSWVASIWPRARFDQIRAKCDRCLAKSGRDWPMSGQIRSISANAGRMRDKFGRLRVKFGPSAASAGRCWPSRAKVGPSRAVVFPRPPPAPTRARATQIPSGARGHRRDVTRGRAEPCLWAEKRRAAGARRRQISQTMVSVQMTSWRERRRLPPTPAPTDCSTSAAGDPQLSNLVELGPNSAEISPNVAESGPSWPIFGRACVPDSWAQMARGLPNPTGPTPAKLDPDSVGQSWPILTEFGLMWVNIGLRSKCLRPPFRSATRSR